MYKWVLYGLGLVTVLWLQSCGSEITSDTPVVETPFVVSENPDFGVGSEPRIVLPSHFNLAWRDEFDGANGEQANSQRWGYDLGSRLLGGSVWGNNENQHYTNSTENSFIENGALVIQPVYKGEGNIDGAASSPHRVVATSARLVSTTDDYYNAIGANPYGYYEIRAKISCAAGSWPAIWMLGRNGVWPVRGEVDIMEWFGRHFINSPNRYTAALHFQDRHGSNPVGNEMSVNNFCDEYQVFHFLWQEDKLVLGINGLTNLVYNRPTNYSSSNWPFTQPAHLLMNIAVGGNLGGDLNQITEVSVADMRMEVDYVRVWQDGD